MVLACTAGVFLLVLATHASVVGRILLENINQEGAAADVGYDDEDDLVIEGPLFTDGSIGIDMNGVYLLVATVGACVLFAGYVFLMKWSKTKSLGYSPIESARFRLFAARGDISGMIAIYKNNHKVLNGHLNGWTALHAAVVNGQCGTALWLLQRGLDVNGKVQDGWNDSLLHYAAEQGHGMMAEILLDFGADPSALDCHGKDPASVALDAGYASIHDYIFNFKRQKVSDTINIGSLKYKGKRLVLEQNGTWSLKEGEEKSADEDILQSCLKRAFEGHGTEGTVIKRHVKVFRVFAIACQVAGVIYLVWRALRSLRPGAGFAYSAVFWLCEFFPFIVSNAFFIALWNKIDRPERLISTMLPSEKMYPTVEVFIVTYNEPLSVLEPTIIACVNMDYPGEKLRVMVLDDGKRPEVDELVKNLQVQMKFMERKATLGYVARQKSKNVPHHAKAGNINSCLMKRSSPDTDFVAVFDCDMIPHPGFLEKTLGHFYYTQGGSWSLKPYCALLQTPQDFWNVNPSDAMVHCARFFYGPMLQGRDGSGACPCCGTGVIFRRDILLSIGGQSYGSITEDYNTSMHLLASGFSTQYLNTRLAFGMAPEDLVGIFRQRLRWAVGALQILFSTNPLYMPGLTTTQSILFFESSFHYFLSISTLVMCVAPLVYVFSEYSPLVVDQLWELCVVFGAYYLINRITMWVAHYSLLRLEYFDSKQKTGGIQLEIWRGSQLWVWMVPNNIKAILKVTYAYIAHMPVKFSVTKKSSDDQGSAEQNVLAASPYLLYYAAYIAAFIYFIVFVSSNDFDAWRVVIYITALAWATLTALYIWPPVSLLLPRRETNQGWKISWKAFLDPTKYKVNNQGRVFRKSDPLRPNIFKSPFDNIPADGSIPDSQNSVHDSLSAASINSPHGALRSSTGAWSNVGRLALPRRTSELLSSKMLLCSGILPEPHPRISRSDSMMDRRVLSLDASGNLSRGTQHPFSPTPETSIHAVLSHDSTGSHFITLRSFHLSDKDTKQERSSPEEHVKMFCSQHGLSLESLEHSILEQPVLSLRGISQALSELTSRVSIPIYIYPEEIYNHTIAAQPYFDELKLPKRSLSYALVNTIMIGALIAAAVLDKVTDHGGPVY
jgi:cellulose synthase/poly-beta-1,6-N-acetylglucosamine synthase-like glycosyltransferase